MPGEIETDAFRRMNFLKYQASRLHAALDPAHASEEELTRIETLLSQAAALKNMILQGNLRVAVHVAHTTPHPTGPSWNSCRTPRSG